MYVCMYVYVNIVTRCWSDDTAWIFSCAMLSGTSGTALHKVFPLQFCPRSIKIILHRIFPMPCYLEPPGLFLCKGIPGVLQQHCTRCFLMQCCLETLGQSCIG